MQNSPHRELLARAEFGYALFEATSQHNYTLSEHNTAFAALQDKEGANLVGIELSVLLPQAANCIAQGEEHSEVVYETKPRQWLKLQCAKLPTGHYSIICTDISRIKRSEQTLEAKKYRVEKQRAATANLLLHPAIVSSDQQQAMPFVSRLLSETIDVARASIWLLSEDGEALHCISLYESQTQQHSAGTILHRKDFPRYFDALCTDTRIYAKDAQNDPRTNEFTDFYLRPLGIAAMLDAGILMNGKVVGVICLEHIGEVRPWHIDEESFTSTAAAVISQILTNAEREKTAKKLLESQENLALLARQQSIEEELREQQEKLLLEISTPITQLWENILLLPLVGGMNSLRAQEIMTGVLNKIAASQAKVFILDISGVTLVDTSVANSFIKLAKATRLMGCASIISGISPAVAQTIIELGIEIDEMQTTNNLQDALVAALRITGLGIMRIG